MKKKDILQIVLNLLAFFVLCIAIGGKGSFYPFLAFLVVMVVILIDILLSEKKVGLWVYVTKVLTYIIICIKFFDNKGILKIEYIFMILISVITLIISRKFVKNRAVALWGQNTASIIGAIMYIQAIISSPLSYNSWHMTFWFINALSYLALIIEVFYFKTEKVNLIFPVYAFINCFVYIGVMIFVK